MFNDTRTNAAGTTATIIEMTYREGYQLFVNCVFINQFDTYIEACCARQGFLNAI